MVGIGGRDYLFLLFFILRERRKKIAVDNIDIQAKNIHDQAIKNLTDTFEYNNEVFKELKLAISKFLNSYKVYESLINWEKLAFIEQDIDLAKTICDTRRDAIWQDFLEVQNLFNAYLGQTIKLTQVVDDKNGYKHIFVLENNIEHIIGKKFGNKYNLVYDMKFHEEQLKNSLPDNNKTLAETARNVQKRYNNRKKHIVFWKIDGQWYGYKLTTRGPINEAFVNFYIHNYEFNNGKEENIKDYMENKDYGAINADNANGFIIGDVEMGRTLYAVKGKGASPQKIEDIAKDLQQLAQNGFTQQAFEDFKTRWRDIEKEKNVTPQIGKLITNFEQDIIDGFERHLKRTSTI